MAPARVRREHSSFPPRPSTMQYYWLRYVCERSTTPPHPVLPPCNSTGSGTCARGVPLLPTPSFHHALLLAPVRVRAMWRWSSSMQLQRPSPTFSTPPFHHTKILAPVRVRKEHRSFPPRPSTITNYWLRCVCEKNTVLFHPALPP